MSQHALQEQSIGFTAAGLTHDSRLGRAVETKSLSLLRATEICSTKSLECMPAATCCRAACCTPRACACGARAAHVKVLVDGDGNDEGKADEQDVHGPTEPLHNTAAYHVFASCDAHRVRLYLVDSVRCNVCGGAAGDTLRMDVADCEAQAARIAMSAKMHGCHCVLASALRALLVARCSHHFRGVHTFAAASSMYCMCSRIRLATPVPSWKTGSRYLTPSGTCCCLRLRRLRFRIAQTWSA